MRSDGRLSLPILFNQGVRLLDTLDDVPEDEEIRRATQLFRAD